MQCRLINTCLAIPNNVLNLRFWADLENKLTSRLILKFRHLLICGNDHSKKKDVVTPSLGRKVTIAFEVPRTCMKAQIQRATAPSVNLRTPTWCQYRGALGHNPLTQKRGLIQIPDSQNHSHHHIKSGSVQHGLSAAIDLLAPGLRCCAADQR